MRTRIAAQVTNVSGRIVRPGAPKPVSRLDLSAAVLEPVKAVAQVVVTEELLAATGPSSEATFNRMLRGGVAEVVDQEFFAIIGQNLTPRAATANPLDDIETLLDDVNTTGAGALYWAMAPTTANAMSAHLATNGNRMFPEMTPVGGALLGLPALVSTAVPAAGSPATNTLWLIDASGIAGDTTEVEVRMSRQALVQMEDNPTGDAVWAVPLGTTRLVSTWQENLVAIEAEVRSPRIASEQRGRRARGHHLVMAPPAQAGVTLRGAEALRRHAWSQPFARCPEDFGIRSPSRTLPGPRARAGIRPVGCARCSRAERCSTRATELTGRTRSSMRCSGSRSPVMSSCSTTTGYGPRSPSPSSAWPVTATTANPSRSRTWPWPWYQNP